MDMHTQACTYLQMLKQYPTRTIYMYMYVHIQYVHQNVLQSIVLNTNYIFHVWYSSPMIPFPNRVCSEVKYRIIRSSLGMNHCSRNSKHGQSQKSFKHVCLYTVEFSHPTKTTTPQSKKRSTCHYLSI